MSAHNLKVVGSNPTPAPNLKALITKALSGPFFWFDPMDCGDTVQKQSKIAPMKNRIRPPVRVDVNERVIPPHDKTTKVWRWRLNVPSSITGMEKERLYFRTQKEANQHAEQLLGAKSAAGDFMEKLKSRGMSITDAISYALKHAPKVEPIKITDAIERFIASRVKGSLASRKKCRLCAGAARWDRAKAALTGGIALQNALDWRESRQS
jgi:hypothetical protein